MITVTCPHCDVFHDLVPIGPAPCYSVEECGACGKTFWLYHSRLNPCSYTEEPKDFGERISRAEDN